MHRASCFKGSSHPLWGPGSSVFFGRLALLYFAPVANMGRSIRCYDTHVPTTHSCVFGRRLRVSSLAAADCGSIPAINHSMLWIAATGFRTQDKSWVRNSVSASQWHKIQRHNLVRRDILIQFLCIILDVAVGNSAAALYRP